MTDDAPGAAAVSAAGFYAYAAVSGFCLVLYAFVLANAHAVWFEPRFALVTLGACVAGVAFGVALGVIPVYRRTSDLGLVATGPLAALAPGALALLTFGSAHSYLLATGLLALPFAAWSFGMSGMPFHLPASPGVRGAAAAASGSIAAAIVAYWALEMPYGPFVLAGLGASGLAAASLLIAPRWGASSLLLTVAVLGLVLIVNGWAPSAPVKWEQSRASSIEKVIPGNAASSVWAPFSYIELAPAPASGNDLAIYLNETFRGLIPRTDGTSGESPGLEKRFPIVALPLSAGRIEKILLANPHGAVELLMAVHRNVSEVHLFDQPNNDRALALAQLSLESLANEARIVRHGAAAPAWRPANLDQIYLTIPQTHPADWTDPDPRENYLFTAERFAEHWARLKPGGTMVILSGDQTLFVRALLQAWEALPGQYRERRPLAAQSWGYRALTAAQNRQPYQYLAIVTKGPVTAGQVERVTTVAKEMPLVPLFGPGIAPGAAYAALGHPAGTPVALPALGQYLVQQQKLLVDIFPATDDRPFFFQPIRDLQLYMKWLVAIALIGISYALLFPLAPLRRFDNPQNVSRPPIPLYLAFFVLVSLSGTGAVSAVVWQGLRYAELGLVLICTMVALVLGLTAGRWLDAREPGRADKGLWRYSGAALAGVTCLTGLFATFVAPRWGSAGSVYYLVPAMLLLSLGAALATSTVVAGIRYSTKLIPGAEPWIWFVIGWAALLGPVTSLWMAQVQGWRTTWISSSGAMVAAVSLFYFLGLTTEPIKAAEGKSRARR